MISKAQRSGVMVELAQVRMLNDDKKPRPRPDIPTVPDPLPQQGIPDTERTPKPDNPFPGKKQ